MASLWICISYISLTYLLITLLGSTYGGSIVEPPSNTTAFTEHNTTLTCQVENQEVDEVFFWYKLPSLDVPESPLMLSHNDLSRDETKYVIREDYTMVIVNVSVEDEGQYQCSVANDVYRAYLTVIDAPNMKVKLSDGSDFVSFGDVVNITCEAKRAYPPVSLRWYKGITEITETASQRATGPDSEGYGDTSSTVEVRISKYDYLGYMLCVADAEDHPEVAVKQYDFDFGAASPQHLSLALIVFAICVYMNVIIV